MRKRSETTKTIIITAARELFLSRGYIGTTVDAIASQAQLTKRTIYGYFPDKRALFKGVIEDAIGDVWEFHISPEDITTSERLRDALYAVSVGINEILSQPNYVQLLRVTIAEIPTQPELDVLFKRGVARRALIIVAELLHSAEIRNILTLKDIQAAAGQFVGGFVLHTFLDGLLQPSLEHLHKQTATELSNYVDDFIGRVSPGVESEPSISTT